MAFLLDSIFKKKREGTLFRIGQWCDIHSHFLPDIDDGCKSAIDSISLMKSSRGQGIVGMIATPHYYPKESIQSFLKRRRRSEEILKRAISVDESYVPRWCLGAEVYYYHGLVNSDDVESLCLGKSRYMLLELPFAAWDTSVIRDINVLGNMYGITPIIAHLERYLNIQSNYMLEMLYETEAIFQMNGSYILDKSTYRNAKKRISNGLVQVLGSDSHNMVDRKPNLQPAISLMLEAGFDEKMEEIRRLNFEIFRDAYGK